MDKYNAKEGVTLIVTREGERKKRKTEKIQSKKFFSLHFSRLHLPHTVTSTRKSDKDTIAHEIVHFLHALAHCTLIILTSFLPRAGYLLALLLRKFIVIKVRILDARREHALNMRKQVVKRHAYTVRRRHLDIPR